MARFGRGHVLPDPAASSQPDPPPFLSAALSPSKFSSTANSRKDPADRRIPERTTRTILIIYTLFSSTILLIIFFIFELNRDSRYYYRRNTIEEDMCRNISLRRVYLFESSVR